MMRPTKLREMLLAYEVGMTPVLLGCLLGWLTHEYTPADTVVTALTAALGFGIGLGRVWWYMSREDN